MILGLDISTSITGATVLDKDGKVFCNYAFDFRNKNYFPTMFHKANHIKGMLLDMQAECYFQKIYIEQSLQAFRPGLSSAKTLLILSKFNGIVSWICWDTLGITPEYIAAPSARKLCDIKVPRGTRAKEAVLKHIIDNEDGFVVEYTRNGNPKPETYDRADSLVVARAGYTLWKKNSKS
tara:strand:+ start:1252 stop:1788 length:537 start_codon:yes stop_codon:yes gene_type:complete